MEDKQIIAFFDFCDTIVNVQSADLFAQFVYRKNTNLILSLINFLHRLFFRIIKMNGYINKRLHLFKLKGISKQKLIDLSLDYYNEHIRVNLNKTVIEALRYHQSKNHKVVIVSGGYKIYIDHFAKEFSVDEVLATDLNFNKGLFTGKIAGRDCLGFEKNLRILELFRLEEFDLINSYVYSDSLTDYPLFSLVGNRVFVCKQCNCHGNEANALSKLGFRVLQV